MRILIISNSFYPQKSPRAYRTTELVKEFCRQNHEVTVLLPESNQDFAGFFSDYHNVVFKMSLRLVKNKIHNRGKLLYYWNLMLTLLLHYPHIRYFLEMPKILSAEEGYDVLITIAYPHPIHWGVARALRAKPDIAKTWIADCGDPYMLGGSRKPYYFVYLEKSFCRIADFITVPFEAAKNGYYKEFRKKIRVIPQAFNFNEINLKSYKPNEIITFAYAGRFVKGDLDPRPIVKFLTTTNIPFRFVVFTNQKFLFEEFGEMIGNSIVLEDFIERLELIKRLSKMDFLLNLAINDPTRRSSKLIDYALTKRPILSINSRDIDAKLFKEFLNRDYTRQTFIDISESNIELACQRFLNLHSSIN